MNKPKLAILSCLIACLITPAQAGVPDTLGITAFDPDFVVGPAMSCKTFDRLGGTFAYMRFMPDWQHIEKQKGVYDWLQTDWMLSEFQKRGIRPVVGLGLFNPLYGVNARIKTDEQREAFGRYVQALVSRYAGRGVVWEVWNEPNISHFWRLDPGETLDTKAAIAEYLALAEYIVPIVRQADPGATVIGPAAANYNTTWLWYAIQYKGLTSLFDGLSVHPYQGATGRPELVIAQHDMVQGWMRASETAGRGPVIPVWFTEIGWSTGKGEVSEETRINYTLRQYLLSLMLGTKANIVYSLINTSPTEPCIKADGCYGLFTRTSGTEQPVFAALSDLVEALRGYEYTRRIGGPRPTTYLLEFRQGDKVRYVVWDSQTTAPYPVILPDGRDAQASQRPVVVEGRP